MPEALLILISTLESTLSQIPALLGNIENIEKVDIIIREGHELIPLPEGNQYPGYIFARANTSDEVIHALRKAYAELNIVVAPLFKLKLAKNFSNYAGDRSRLSLNG